MKHHIVKTTIIPLALLVCAGTIAARSASSAEGGWKETEIKLTDMPEAARAAVLKSTNAQSVKTVTKETKNGIDTFEVDYMDGQVACAMIVSAAGDAIETERGVALDRIPAAAIAAVKARFPSAQLGDAVIATKMTYEINVTIDGKKVEVKVDASGSIDGGKKEWGAEKKAANGKDGKKDGQEDEDEDEDGKKQDDKD